MKKENKEQYIVGRIECRSGDKEINIFEPDENRFQPGFRTHVFGIFHQKTTDAVPVWIAEADTFLRVHLIAKLLADHMQIPYWNALSGKYYRTKPHILISDPHNCSPCLQYVGFDDFEYQKTRIRLVCEALEVP